jgi:Protein of unknown function (DUF1257)
MSHFTTIKVQIKDGQVLADTLLELGHHVEQNTFVRGYEGDTTSAEYVIRRDNGYDIGFQKDRDDSYEVVADFWGVAIDETQFANQIQQKYAHKMLLITAAERGYTIESEELLENGTVRVLVGRWA